LTPAGKELMRVFDKERGEAGNGDLPIPENLPISLSKSALMFAKIDLPALNAFIDLAEHKKLHELVADWQFFARLDGKIHPLYAWTTAAGRASTSEPNPLGAPRDKRIRGLLCNSAGWKVPVADYSAIELRIAVANAEKAIEETRLDLLQHNRYNVNFNGTQAWFLRNCWTSKQLSPPDYPSDAPPEGVSKEEWAKVKSGHILKYFAGRVLDKEIQALAAVFNAGVDPHLATALTMLRLCGEIDFPGTATEYLVSFSQEEQEALKEKYKRARQRAKAVNFGLLYGMRPETLHRYGITNYGLDWTLEDARAAYSMWFELYPEIGFYHCFVRHMRSTKTPPGGSPNLGQVQAGIQDQSLSDEAV
jgi:DNA polymerase-1